MPDRTVLLDVWSDLHCPWALLCVHRLRTARAELGLTEVVINPRAWPLEWVNERGTPRDIVATETIVLHAEEPALFSRYDDPSWPSTFLPAFELVAAARRVGGPRAAEEVDYALRLAFFRDGIDVSIEHGLRHALALAASHDPGIDTEAILRTWYREPVRADVRADFELSRTLPIQGSPQLFLPSGVTLHNPGLTDHDWERGIPRIRHRDPGRPASILRALAAGTSRAPAVAPAPQG
jgi:predicted DsbA family dithiol-disulfide isomerase